MKEQDEIIRIKKNSLKVITKLKNRITELENEASDEPIAIIGMGCSFPGGANSPEAFWKLLKDGRDAISKVPLSRWDVDEIYSEEAGVPGKMNTREGGFLEDIDQFDNAFFELSASEAKYLDPQHRLLMEITWQALENAGLSKETLYGSQTGVFMGLMTREYDLMQSDGFEDIDSAAVSNAPSILSGRLSYWLGLKGPSITLDTACSSSLVAMDMAIEKIRNGGCDMAIAGGVSLILTPALHIGFGMLQGLASDGRCRTFSDQAKGVGWSEGCGVVILKPLSKAQADGDNILALIKGSAVNQDGKSQGISAPNGPSQEAVIKKSLQRAKLSPDQVDYVECHGTGTSLGDPIEVQALGKVYGSVKRSSDSLVIGSVKSNMGHTLAAAGVAGVIKTVLSMQHGMIPKSLHSEELNEKIDWEAYPVKVAQDAIPWEKNGSPRRAGVSSFGISGTNAHIILEEAPAEAPEEVEETKLPARSYQLLTLSGEGEEALQGQQAKLKAHIESHSEQSPEALAYSLSTTRSHFRSRLGLVVSDKESLLSKLSGPIHPIRTSPGKLAFLYTGGGSQYTGMAKELYETEKTFATTFDQCLSLIQQETGEEFKQIIFASASTAEAAKLDQIDYMLLALFAVEYSLTRLWQSWGIEPDILMGHSLGELVAATVAGVFSLEDGIRLVAARGKLMASVKQAGKMATVEASIAELQPYLDKETSVSVAGENGPRQTLISGAAAGIESIADQLKNSDIKAKVLPISQASHSPLMEEILPAFWQVAGQITYHAPQYPIISNVSGRLAGEEIQSPDYWTDHIRQTVLFSSGMQTLEQEGVTTYLEMGAEPSLVGMGGHCVTNSEDCQWLASLQSEGSDEETILKSVAALYEAGYAPNWDSFYQDREQQKVSLPTYAFQRKRHWIEERQNTRLSQEDPLWEALESANDIQLESLLGGELNRENLSCYFKNSDSQPSAARLVYETEWRPYSSSEASFYAQHWLLLDKDTGSNFKQSLQSQFQKSGGTLALAKDEDAALDYLSTEDSCMGLISVWARPSSVENINEQAEATAITALKQLQKLSSNIGKSIFWITEGLFHQDQELQNMAIAPLWGLVRVFLNEYPGIRFNLLDISDLSLIQTDTSFFTQSPVDGNEPLLKYKDGEFRAPKLVRSERIADNTPPDPFSGLTDRSVIITGGLGYLGMLTAEWLIEKNVGELILTGRSQADAKTDQQIDSLRAPGTTVRYVPCNVADKASLKSLVNSTDPKRPLGGIVHAAGVLDDALLMNQSATSFEKVFSAKVHGTQYLHELTIEHDLSFFILYSSLSSVFGTAGQANYAAANSFMDAFAHKRASMGLPVSAVNWGLWKDGLVDAGILQAMTEQGIMPLQKEKAFLAMERQIEANSINPAIFHIEWEKFRAFSQGTGSALLSEITASQKGKSSPTGNPYLYQLKGLTFAEQKKKLTLSIKEIVAELLNQPTQAVNERIGFLEMGMTSLQIVELSRMVGRQLGIKVSVRSFFQYPLISDLVDKLLEGLDTEISVAADLSPIEELVTVDSRTEERSRLSTMQERLWFLHQLNPGSAEYNTFLELAYTGDFDRVILEKVLSNMVNRHEALRTIIVQEEGRAYMQICEPYVPEVTLIDLTEIKEELRSERLSELRDEQQNISFDFDKPAFVVVLVKMAAQKYQLLITQHHLFTDGYSTMNLLRELIMGYDSLRQNAPSVSEVQTSNYFDFVKSERAFIQSEQFTNSLDYWTRKLTDLPALRLPVSRLISQHDDKYLEGEHIYFNLSTYQSIGLMGLAAHRKVSLNSLLFSLYAVLLNKYTGQDDFGIGTIHMNRDLGLFQEVQGFFVNTLVWRCRFEREDTFDSFLKSVHQQSLESEQHHRVPYQEVVKAVAGDQTSGEASLFNCSFSTSIFQAQEKQKDSSWAANGFLADTSVKGVAKDDLSLSMGLEGDELVGVLEYRKALFDAKLVQQFKDHFINLIDAVLSHPGGLIYDFEILAPAEKQLLLEDFNSSKVSYPIDETVVDLFESQVTETPDKVAVVCGDVQFTYDELNERANRLANYLRQQGARPEQLVGICLGRSADMLTAALGVLKSGAAFVPFDSALPASRLSFMIEDSQVLLTLTDASTHSLISHPDQRNEILDSILTEAEGSNPSIDISQSSMAYMIYTSGSTGQPKGVMIEHGNLSNMARAYADTYDLKANPVAMLQIARMSFDVFVGDLCRTVLFGGRLVIAQEESRTDVAALAGLIAEQKISALDSTPSLIVPLMRYMSEHQSATDSLKYIIMGADVLAMSDYQWLLSRFNDEVSMVANTYGPTECTVEVTRFLPAKGSLPDLTNSPIGKPYQNSSIYIVDNSMNPVPTGVSGEILIGGAQVGRGYWQQPELTSQKFIKSPFVEGERLFRTGDFGRWLPDGDIEFQGRQDNQIKIRGFRIELGEIESTINKNPSVEQAIVQVHEAANKSKQLVAYVSGKELEDMSALKEQAFADLPSYMVPQHWVLLDAMPLTANGKLDRKALTRLVDLDDKSEYVAPRNETEAALAGIWADILKVEQVGVFDNFFDLGGHSLLVMQVISAIQASLNLETSVSDVFQYATIHELAEHLKNQEKGRTLPLIAATERTGRIPLSYSQERLWFLHQLEGSLHYHMPGVFKMTGEVDLKALENAFRAVIKRHEVLRTVLKEEEGQAYQEVRPESGWGITFYDGIPEGKPLEDFIIERINTPFDLSADFPLRVEILEHKPSEYFLITVLHHISSDGWSEAILIREFAALYEAEIKGEAGEPEPLSLQYADYAIWQRAHITSGFLEQQLNFWKQQLQGSIPLRLPGDFPRPAIRSTRGDSIQIQIDKAVTDQFKLLSSANDVSFFMGLMSAFKVLLHRYTDQQDIAVGTPVANRTQEETGALIGFFANTLVIRDQVRPEMSFVELIQEVRATCLAAYDHQETPFEKVVEALNVTRDLSDTPLFQVAFALQSDESLQEINIDGLSLELEQVKQSASKFDLTFIAGENQKGLELYVEYSTDLFSKATVLKMTDHFVNLLRAIVSTPNCSIGQLPMISQAEHTQLLSGFNETEVEYSGAVTILDLISECMLSSGSSPALVFEDEELSYAELDARVNQLIHYLMGKGVVPGMLVPVCMERSFEMLVSLLAIMKSGAAYVPIDPSYPESRISFVLEDCEASVILTDNKTAGLFSNSAATLINLNQDNDIIADESTEALDVNISADMLCYMIYTSGSTGKPKGVMIEHGSLLNRLQWAGDYFNVTSSDTFIQKTSFGFDVSVWELFLPLMHGSRLVIARPEGHKDPDYLRGLIEAQGVNIIHFVPSMLGAFMRGMDTSIACLQTVVCSGEALQLHHAEEFNKLFPESRLVNLYGPTEATIDVSYWEVPKDLTGLHNLPIGRPVANTQLYVADRSGSLCPVGVPGELLIGGVQVGRGYLNRNELTSERFINNPYGEGRLYRTGDKARWLADGNMEYLGRLDDQVKIRGFRIEPGEIEHELVSHEVVSEAVVVPRSVQGSDSLVAYYVPDGDTAPALQQLLRAQNELPEGSSMYEFGNGLSLAGNNKKESSFLYEEIFENESYLKHGISIPDNGVIFDVGANIGMFSVFSSLRGRDVSVYSFEPIPPVYELLSVNTSIYAGDFRLYPMGLSSEAGKVTFNYYPNASILSGIGSEEVSVRDTVRQYILNDTEGAEDLSATDLELLLEERLVTESYECELGTVSGVMSENKLDFIDLLKIDVENAEEAVLSGIAAEDWSKIGQLVVEVHDVDGRLSRVSGLLKSKGYRVVVDQTKELAHTALYDIYAIAESYEASPSTAREGYWGFSACSNELQQHLGASLPPYMVPARFVPLASMPLTASGKIDKKALPVAEATAVETTTYEAPGNEVEAQLASIWAEILGLEQVGIHDSFFQLGGDSILVIRAISQIEKAFGVRIDLAYYYQHPRVRELAAYLSSDLANDQNALSEQRRQEVEQELDSLKQEVKQSEKGQLADVYPMADIQIGMVFHALADEGEGVYHHQTIYSYFNHELSLIKQALILLTDKHETLRTSFNLHDFSRPVQIIRPAADIPLDCHDLRSHDSKQAEGFIKDHMQQALKQPFEINQAPLCRLTVFLLDEEKAAYLLEFHHAILDGWSVNSWFAELFSLLSKLEQKVDIKLEKLKCTHRDHIIESQIGKLNEGYRSFWKNELTGSQRPELLSDTPVEKVVEVFDLADLSEIKKMAQQEGVSLKAVFFSAYLYLLNALQYDQDLTVGLVSQVRPLREDGDKLLGCFLNTVPFRWRFDNAALSWSDYLGLIEEKLIALKGRDRLSLLELSKMMEEETDNHNPFTDVLFNYVDFHMLEDLVEGQDLEALKTDVRLDSHEKTNYPFGLSVSVTMDKLYCNFYQQNELISGLSLDDLARAYGQVLKRMAEKPAALMSDQHLFGKGHDQLLAGFNETKVDHSGAVTILDLISERMLSSGSSPALVFEGKELSYAELDARVNQLSHYLKGKGVVPGMLVPVCVERSFEMLVSLLAIMKSGGAYVPIDPSYPKSRISFVLEDCEASVILADNKTVGLFSNSEVTLINLNQDHTSIAGESTEAAEVSISADMLCYMIYTSGSTGKPKGVMIEHGSLLNRLQWAGDYFNVTSSDTFIQKTSFGFDVSVWELFLPLMHGSRLVIARPEGHKDPDYLRGLIEAQGVNIIHFVPSMLGAFMRGMDTSIACLQTVVCSGEALQLHHAEEFNKLFPESRLVNLYGPTEATIDVSYWEVPKDLTGLHNLPIGRPVANTQLYVADRSGSLCPVGVPGELLIGGVQVGRGYLNRNELTSERFINNPYGEGRLYRTGDKARWLADGNMEYLGRLDDQVKIRGFRIEPGEIEHELVSHEVVSEAVVVPRSVQGSDSLVAYYVPDGDTAPALQQLLRAQNELPEGSSMYEFGNGLSLAGNNKKESSFLYEEIFENESYLKHGISIPDNGVIFDVGANIGMFSVFSSLRGRDVSVYSFEPIPPVYELLSVNTSIYAGDFRLYPMGLSSEAGKVTFNYYPNASILSGIGSEEVSVRDTVRQYILNDTEGAEDLSATDLELLLEERLVTESYECELGTVSGVMSENKLGFIDLLKIDVENAEEAVLSGIAAEDWPKIGQLVVEVHDVDGRLSRVSSLLKSKGYRVVVDQTKELAHTALYDIYAIADSYEARPSTAREGYWGFSACSNELQQHLGASLPPYMVPARFVPLVSMPLTASGKIDKKALPVAEATAVETTTYEAPGNEVEAQLASIWAEILGLEQVGIHDSFFQLGGDSILAMRAMLQVKQQLEVNLVVTDIYSFPTISKLAAHLTEHEAPESVSKFGALTAFRPKAKKIPVICLPGLGGLSFMYKSLFDGMDHDRPFFAFSSPIYEPGFYPGSVAELAERYLADMQAVLPEGPCVLAGHSLGGRVAYEMARQLEESGRKVEQLILLDASLNEEADDLSEEDQIEMTGNLELDNAWLLTVSYYRLFGKQLSISHTAFKAIFEKEQHYEWMEKNVFEWLALPETNQDQTLSVKQVLEAYQKERANDEDYIGQVQNYRINAPITLLQAKGQLPLEPVESDCSALENLRERTTGLVRGIPVQGNHTNMISKENAAYLAEAIEEILTNERDS